MKKVYITRKINQVAIDILSKHFEVHSNKLNKSLEYSKLFNLVENFDAILSMPNDRFDKDVLNKKKNLQVISNYAVGLDNIDILFAKKNGISVFNTPDVVTNSTADHVFALLFEFSRKTREACEFIKKDKWNYWDPEIFVGEEYSNKILGIIGFGRIGQAVARRAIGFGFKIVYFDSQSPLIDVELQNRISQVSFKQILNMSNYISLHVPLNSETKDFISKNQFKKMEKCPVFINTSRGGVVNTNDLVYALKNKLIRAALLDVCNPEPLKAQHELLSFSNCLITPHIGTATIETRFNMARLAAENIVHYFNDERI